MLGEFRVYREEDGVPSTPETPVQRMARELEQFVLSPEEEELLRARLLEVEMLIGNDEYSVHINEWNAECVAIHNKLTPSAMAAKFIELSQKQKRSAFETSFMKQIAKDFGKSL